MIEHVPATLNSAFEFSQEELSLNRSGMLSRTQRNSITQELSASRIQGGIWIGLYLTVAAILFGIPLVADVPERDQFAYRASIVGVLVPLAFFLIIRTLNRRRKLTEVRDLNVRMVQGRAEMRTERARSKGIDWVYFLLVVDGVKFHLTPNQYAQLTADEIYCVYYVPHDPGHHVLSLEHLTRVTASVGG